MDLLVNPYVQLVIFMTGALAVFWLAGLMFHLRCASEHLAVLRNSVPQKAQISPLSSFCLLIYHLNRGQDSNFNLYFEGNIETKINPRWIGSSKTEFEEFRRRIWKDEAKVILSLLRSGVYPLQEASRHLTALRDATRRAGLILEDIGTSQEELDDLQQKYSGHRL